MNSEQSNMELEEVLDAFIMEEDTGKATLLRYLNDFPQFASDLVDLSREMTLGTEQSSGPLSKANESIVAAAWKRHAAVVPGGSLDPLGSLLPTQLNQLSAAFSLPRQVFSALRERRVIVASISESFLSSLSEKIGCPFDRLVASLNEPAQATVAGSHKSDVKPEAPRKVTFEQILTDAEIGSDRLAELVRGE